MAGGLLGPPSGLGCDDTRDSHSPVQGFLISIGGRPASLEKSHHSVQFLSFKVQNKATPVDSDSDGNLGTGGQTGEGRGLAQPQATRAHHNWAPLGWGQGGGASRMTEPPQMLLKGIYCKNMVFVFLSEN